MKPIRWVPHALENLAAREIPGAEADKTLLAPEFVVPGEPPRSVLIRRYHDPVLNQPMLLRIVVEDRPDEIVVVTLYKTSHMERYLRGLVP